MARNAYKLMTKRWMRRPILSLRMMSTMACVVLGLVPAGVRAQVLVEQAMAIPVAAAAADEADDTPKAEWTIDEMMGIARDMLDENWPNRLKYYRMVARTRFDEVRNICRLDESQLRKLAVAAEGQAFKRALQERAMTEDNIQNMLRSYHQRGTGKGQVRAMVGNYANQRIYYSSRNNSPESFWKQAIANTLDDEQVERLEKRDKERAARLKKLSIDRMIAQLDLYVRLTPKQEEQVRELFEPMLGAGRIQVGPNSFMHIDEFNMMEMNTWSLMRGAKAKEMQKILTESQWEMWKGIMQERGGGWGIVDEVMVEEEAVEEEAEDKVEEGEEAKTGDKAKTGEEGGEEKKGGEDRAEAASAAGQPVEEQATKDSEKEKGKGDDRAEKRENGAQ